MSNCDGDCKRCLLADQPPDDREFTTPDGVFVKEMFLARANTAVPQHAHTYAHTSYLVRGSVRAWAGAALLGDFHAPKPIEIAAHVKHTFMSLEDNTTILCIHNLNGAATVEIAAEHQFKGVV